MTCPLRRSRSASTLATVPAALRGVPNAHGNPRHVSENHHPHTVCPANGTATPNLLNRLADALRPRHYSRRTEQAYLLEDGSDIRIIQELLGRTDVSTTMNSTPVLTKGGPGVRSPGDAP